MKQLTILLDDWDSIQVFFQQQQSTYTTMTTTDQQHFHEYDNTRHDQYESKNI